VLASGPIEKFGFARVLIAMDRNIDRNRIEVDTFSAE
jgi:hypothetical protein